MTPSLGTDLSPWPVPASTPKVTTEAVSTAAPLLQAFASSTTHQLINKSQSFDFFFPLFSPAQEDAEISQRKIISM